MQPKKDLLITAFLRQNARIKLTVLSRRTGVPVSTLYDSVLSLESLGIKRYCALLDFAKLGFPTQATLMLKAVPEKREQLQDHLLKAFPVNSLLRVNNGFDYMADCVFRDMRELEEFCEQLSRTYGLKSKEVHFVVQELKREGFLSDPEHVKEVLHEFVGKNS